MLIKWVKKKTLYKMKRNRAKHLNKQSAKLGLYFVKCKHKQT